MANTIHVARPLRPRRPGLDEFVVEITRDLGVFFSGVWPGMGRLQPEPREQHCQSGQHDTDRAAQTAFDQDDVGNQHVHEQLQ